MWWTIIAQMLGSAAGEAASRMDKEQAMALIKSVSDEYGKINLPKLKEVLLQQAPKSEFAGIKEDPAYRAQQESADAQLNDVINSGGLTLADKATLNAIQNKIARGESAGRNAIEQQMAARGSLDSGAQLAMQLQGSQQAANSAAEAGAQTAGAAQERLYRAIQQRGQNAGQGLDRSYRQQSDAARARDAINAGNTAIANAGMIRNAGLGQQDFQNQMSLANAKAGPAYALGGAHAANAQDTRQAYQSGANAIGAAGKYAQDNSGNSGNNRDTSYDLNNQNLNSFDSGTQSTANDFTPNAYPGSSSDALVGQSSRPKRVKEIVGYDDNGKPMYGYRTAA